MDLALHDTAFCDSTHLWYYRLQYTLILLIVMGLFKFLNCASNRSKANTKDEPYAKDAEIIADNDDEPYEPIKTEDGTEWDIGNLGDTGDIKTHRGDTDPLKAATERFEAKTDLFKTDAELFKEYTEPLQENPDPCENEDIEKEMEDEEKGKGKKKKKFMKKKDKKENVEEEKKGKVKKKKLKKDKKEKDDAEDTDKEKGKKKMFKKDKAKDKGEESDEEKGKKKKKKMKKKKKDKEDIDEDERDNVDEQEKENIEEENQEKDKGKKKKKMKKDKEKSDKEDKKKKKKKDKENDDKETKGKEKFKRKKKTKKGKENEESNENMNNEDLENNEDITLHQEERNDDEKQKEEIDITDMIGPNTTPRLKRRLSDRVKTLRKLFQKRNRASEQHGVSLTVTEAQGTLINDPVSTSSIEGKEPEATVAETQKSSNADTEDTFEFPDHLTEEIRSQVTRARQNKRVSQDISLHELIDGIVNDHPAPDSGFKSSSERPLSDQSAFSDPWFNDVIPTITFQAAGENSAIQHFDDNFGEFIPEKEPGFGLRQRSNMRIRASSDEDVEDFMKGLDSTKHPEKKAPKIDQQTESKTTQEKVQAIVQEKVSSVATEKGSKFDDSEPKPPKQIGRREQRMSQVSDQGQRSSSEQEKKPPPPSYKHVSHHAPAEKETRKPQPEKKGKINIPKMIVEGCMNFGNEPGSYHDESEEELMALADRSPHFNKNRRQSWHKETWKSETKTWDHETGTWKTETETWQKTEIDDEEDDPDPDPYKTHQNDLAYISSCLEALEEDRDSDSSSHGSSPSTSWTHSHNGYGYDTATGIAFPLPSTSTSLPGIDKVPKQVDARARVHHSPVRQSSVKSQSDSSILEKTPNLYRVEERVERKRDNKCGATGAVAEVVNGYSKKSSKTCHNVPIYVHNVPLRSSNGVAGRDSIANGKGKQAEQMKYVRNFESLQRGSIDQKSYILNGQSLRVCTIQECMACSDSSGFWSSQDMPPELQYLQIDPADYRSVIEDLKRCHKIRHYSIWYNRWLHSCVFMVIFAVTWSTSFAVWTNQGFTARTGAGVLFLFAVAVTILCSCICGCVKRKFDVECRRVLAKVNELLSSKYNVILGLVEEGALSCYRLSMHFLYFDSGPCLERLTQDLNSLVERKPSKGSKKSQSEGFAETDMMVLSKDITEKQRQEFSRQLVFRYCDMFINGVVGGRIRRLRNGRHSKDGPCLCQFIGQRFFNLRDEELA